MKKIIAIIMTILMAFILVGCGDKITIEVNDELNPEVYVGETIDYTKLFVINKNGKEIAINEEMLDYSNVDLLKAGEYKVIIKYGDLEKEVTITVKEKVQKLDSIKITNAQDIMAGDTLLLNIVKVPNDNTDPIAYSSSDETIATVVNGLVTALKEGVVTIKATCLDKESSVMIIVTKSIEDNKLTKIEIINKITELSKGSTYKVEFAKMPTTASGDVVITSSDESIISVTNGELLAIKEGTATIKVSCGEIYDEMIITVKSDNTPSYKEAFNKLADDLKWNFQLHYVATTVGYPDETYEEIYRYDGINFENDYTGFDGNNYKEYVVSKNDVLYYFYDNGDGTYSIYNEDTEEFYDFFDEVLTFDFAKLLENQFTYKDGLFYAVDPLKVNNDVFGEFSVTPVFECLTVKISNDYVTEIVCKYSIDGEGAKYDYVDTFTLSEYGKVTINVDDLKIQGETIPELTNLEITNGKDLKVTEQLLLEVVKTPSNVSGDITYSSSDETVATVVNGLVTALKEGTVTIYAECLNKKASITINVTKVESTDKLTAITITNKISELAKDSTYKLEYAKTPSYVSGDVVITSSDEKVISIVDGELLALAEGTATIRVICGELFDEMTITVKLEVADYKVAFNKLIDASKWNFKLVYKSVLNEYPEYDYADSYCFNGENFVNSYVGMDGNDYNDYYILENGVFYLYADNGDGTYSVYDENTDKFNDSYDYTLYIDFSKLLENEYIYKDGLFFAKDPAKLNNEVFGEFETTPEFESFSFKIENDYVTEIVCKYSYEEDQIKYGYTDTTTISEYGKVDIDVEALKEKVVTDVEPTGEITTFTDKNLTQTGNVQYSASRVGYNYDEIRGVQFLQNDGKCEISSKTTQQEVKSVTLVVATNADNGMTVKVKIGQVYLTINGSDTYTVPKTNFDVTNTIVFTSEAGLDGTVVIELIPSGTKKSMYILSIGLDSKGISEVTEVMPNQVYDNNTFDDNRLQDLVLENDECIGLPSIGSYNILVIPVQFTSSSITSSEMTMLEKAFNGTSEDTGWESVKTYYQKSSLGNLNMSFDIMTPFTTKNSASYYEKYSRTVTWEDGSTTTQGGEELILLEALAYYEPLIDFTKYDFNNDKVIDGIYLIYDNPIQYEGSSDFFWAYTTWYTAPENENKTFDGIDAYYYLFAGLDFMIEDAEDGFEYNGTIEGLKINTATYIHETGHMLSLDDYYDYFADKGANRGLGGADMMDSTIGDHSSYSKIMLDWITPTIVTTTQTITIKAFETNGDAILIPLNFNNSYMSEYLLIDLYTATDLNALHAGINYFFGDADCGIRIYHVSSVVDEPYADEYGSFTKNNNSTSVNSLLYLIEADGESNFQSGNGYVTANDLWQTNDTLLGVYSKFAREDGKLVNFDIKVDSVSINEATITITYK